MAVNITRMARIVYDADRGYLDQVDHADVQPSWGSAGLQWQRFWKKTCQIFLANQPGNGLDAHEPWRQHWLGLGWTVGATFSTSAKTHPLLVALQDMTDVQRRREHLQITILYALQEGWSQALIDTVAAEAI